MVSQLLWEFPSISELELTRNIVIFQNPLWKKFRGIPVLIIWKSQREWCPFVSQVNIYSFKFCWCVSLLFFEVTQSCSLLLFSSYMWDLSGVKLCAQWKSSNQARENNDGHYGIILKCDKFCFPQSHGVIWDGIMYLARYFKVCIKFNTTIFIDISDIWYAMLGCISATR